MTLLKRHQEQLVAVPNVAYLLFHLSLGALFSVDVFRRVFFFKLGNGSGKFQLAKSCKYCKYCEAHWKAEWEILKSKSHGEATTL